MAHQHTADRTIAQQCVCLIFSKIVTPGPERGYGYAAADSEKSDAVNGDLVAVKDMGTFPVAAGVDQFFFGFTVTGHQHGWFINAGQGINDFRKPPSADTEIAGPDNDIDTGGNI